MIAAVAIGLGFVALASAAGWWVTARRLRTRTRADAERLQRLEGRLSQSEARRHDAEQRAAEAEGARQALREAAGLEGARPVPAIQVEDLHRSASLVAACLAGGDGLPHAGAGPLDAVEALAAFAGALAPRLPSGVTLLARDERGAEIGARLVHVEGAPRILVAESMGALPLASFERTALRLDPEPLVPPPPSGARPTRDERLAPLVDGAVVDAALLAPEGAGVSASPEAGARLLDAMGLLDEAMRWLDDYAMMRASCVQLRDRRGAAALLRAGALRVGVATRAEGLDVLTEQRLAGIARRRVRITDRNEEAA